MKRILIILLGILLAGSAIALTVNQNVYVYVVNVTNITNENYPVCAFADQNIILSADIIWGECENEVWVGVKIGSNAWENYTASYLTNSTYTYTINSSLLSGNENLSFQFFARDCFNFTYNGSLQTFYVIQNTQLTVSLSSPDGAGGWYITEPTFSLTSDPNGTNIYYQWDSTGPILYTSPFGLDDIPNSPPKESAGTLELNWWTDFGECGNESEQTQMFYIDLINPQIIDLQPGEGEIVYNNLRQTISAYLDEVYQSNSGIEKSSVVIKVDGVDVTSDANVDYADSIDVLVSYVPTSDLLEGLHNVSVYAEDKAGRSNEIYWEFYINITDVFGFQINSPVNGTYGSKRIQFDMTATEKLETMEYINWNDNKPKWKRLCRNCIEYGNKRKKTKTLNEGENNITIRGVDYYGQVKEENISLFIDSKKPKISRIMPRRNSVVNGSEFYIKYTEDNLQDIKLFWNQNKTLTNCSSGKNQECTTSVNLSSHDGEWIEYYFELSDPFHVVESKITRVFVDVTSPDLKINLPEKNQTYGRKVSFNMTVSEDVTLEYIDNLANKPRWRRLCSRCDEYGESRKKTKSFKSGKHKVVIRAVDGAGNSDEEIVEFEVSY